MRTLKILWLIFILFAFAYVVYSIDVHELHLTFQAVSPWIIVLLLGLQCVTWCLILWQWTTLFSVIQLKLPMTLIHHMMFIGTFYDTMTPAMKVGGETAKIMFLKHHGIRTSKSAAVIATQKTMSIAAFLLLCIISLSMLPLYVSLSQQMRIFLWLSLLFLIAIVIVLIVFVRAKTTSSWLTSFKETIKIHTSKKVIMFQFLLSLVIWGLFALKAYLLCQAFALNLAFWPVAVFTFMAYLVAMIPLSPGGIGSFEGTFVLFLTMMAIPLPISVSIAILMRFITHWSTFFISALYVFTKTLIKKKETPYGKIQVADS